MFVFQLYRASQCLEAKVIVLAAIILAGLGTSFRLGQGVDLKNLKIILFCRLA